MVRRIERAARDGATGSLKAYVDTSVLLRIVLGEPRRLREWRSVDLAVASELVRIEALRTIDRARVRLRAAT